MPARALVIGRTGQLARELARTPAPFETVFLGRDALDLVQPEAAADAVASLRPDLVLIAAAYTAVDRAEAEEALARRVNADAPRAVAEACAQMDAALVHVSTDYVFDGAKPTPYLETDSVAPLGAYGRTKAEGDGGVLASGARAAVVRTSWVYSPWGSNFVKTVLRLSRERDELRIVADQHGRPTSAADLARALLDVGARLLDRDPAVECLLHYAGGGEASWADLAEAVVAGSAARGGRAVPVRPIATADFPTPAPRPANSRLDTSRINALGIGSPPWRESLERCLDELLAPAAAPEVA